MMQPAPLAPISLSQRQGFKGIERLVSVGKNPREYFEFGYTEYSVSWLIEGYSFLERHIADTNKGNPVANNDVKSVQATFIIRREMCQ